MASLATIFKGFAGVSAADYIPTGVRAGASSCRLRPLANEDVYLFVKRIDNSAVVRVANPSARRTRAGSVAAGFAAALLVIAGLFPAAYNTMEGYHIQKLRQEQEKLKTQLVTLDLQEAQLLSPENLERMALSLKMTDPVPQQVQWLDGKAQREAKVSLPNAGVSAH